MIRLQAIGLYASDFSGGNTRLGDAAIIDDGTYTATIKDVTTASLA